MRGDGVWGRAEEVGVRGGFGQAEVCAGCERGGVDGEAGAVGLGAWVEAVGFVGDGVLERGVWGQFSWSVRGTPAG